MTKSVRMIQFILLALGMALLLSVYWIYPKFTEEKNKQAIIEKKEPLNDADEKLKGDKKVVLVAADQLRHGLRLILGLEPHRDLRNEVVLPTYPSRVFLLRYDCSFHCQNYDFLDIPDDPLFR